MSRKKQKSKMDKELERIKKEQEENENMSHKTVPKNKAQLFRRYRKFESNMLYHYLKEKKKL